MLKTQTPCKRGVATLSLAPRWLCLPMLCLSLTGCGGGSADPATLAALPQLGFNSAKESIDLNNYSLVRKHALPDVPAASAVTYNADTDSLFMVGDGATRIVQVNKNTAATIDLMGLQAGDFNDTEGLSYVGNGVFVVLEERLRQANQFRYVAGGLLARGAVKSLKLGTDVGNTGLEGISHDPVSNSFVLVKEKDPQGVFATTLNFDAGTASNGGPGLANALNLFDPGLLAVLGLNDLAALSKVLPASAPDQAHLLLLSSASGQVLKADRAGKVYSNLDVGTVPHHEGITIDSQFNIYLVNELGTAGKIGAQELWVYSPTRSTSAVGLGSNLYLTFATKVAVGSGVVTISNGVDDVRAILVTDSSRVEVSGATVMLNPKGKLKPSTRYTIQYPQGAFKDAATGEALAAQSAQALGFNTATLLP
jgi:uncharacterized protein YjiK